MNGRWGMRRAALIFALVMYPMAASAALLDSAQIDATRLLPPPPVAGSATEKREIAELKAIAARSTPEILAAATHDAEDEPPDIFNAALGFDVATRPATFKLLDMVVKEEDEDTKAPKAFFHRLRPYSVDSGIKTCEPVNPASGRTPIPAAMPPWVFPWAWCWRRWCRRNPKSSWRGHRNMPRTVWFAVCIIAATLWRASNSAPCWRSG